MLAVSDEGLRAVKHIAIARLLCRRAHALQVGAGARLAHGDRADELTSDELGQPAPFLLVGAVVQNRSRNDAGMRRRPEGVETRKAQSPTDPRFVREGAAGAAVFFRDRRAKEPGRAGFVPDFAAVSALLVPRLQVRNIL